jgi:hypothetical protein
MDDEDQSLAHYGILRKSGRYPWGSGEEPNQRNKAFLDHVNTLKKQGLTEVQIAEGLGIKTTELRAARSIAKNELRKADIAEAQKLKDKGMSNVAIAARMGKPEPTVRDLLKPGVQEKADNLSTISNYLADQVKEKGYLDVGAGTENHLGVSGTKLNTAVAMLEEQGYKRYYVKVDQLGTGKQTTIKVLAPPDTPYSEVYKNRANIKSVAGYSEDGGRNILGIETPKSIDSKRIEVKYGPEGGADKDGVIEVRRGVDDVSLGGAKYAQVRVAVDGTHYLKGMAMYADDLPPGVDIRFNTNKDKTGNKLDAMKAMKDDPDNPFGAVVRQRHYTDANGKSHLSPMNIVNEEGNWLAWSSSLSSQMLSKQSTTLAKKQLDIAYQSKQKEFEEISRLTNPAIKKKLLDSFADDADSSAVHLKAASLPRQGTHVILPISTMKENEIYAPNYRNGEKVVLVRYPHGGTFEIPELTVNNRHPDAKRILGNAKDAVGIHHKVAQRLSGADFDGDTVLVIPNNDRKVQNSPPLKGLKGFDPQAEYPAREGMKPFLDSKKKWPAKQQKMGEVSNLITDMTIKKAGEAELARAVRHSMVVIDAEKHNLDWRLSAQQNGIAELRKKYQSRPDGKSGGASTLISKASSTQRVPERKVHIDPATGKKVYENIDSSYINKSGKSVPKTVKSTKMAEADDAHTLSSGTPMESVYADHANRLKALANTARKDMIATPNTPYSASAKAAYKPQVDTLKAKLNIALKNQPLERQAQLLANATVSAKRQADPDMDPADLKKIKGQALTAARIRTGAAKQRIEITPEEWNAIQAGAVSTNVLNQILNNTDIDRVKALATPRESKAMTPDKVALAKARLASGNYTQAEIADSLGVSTTTLNEALS